MLLPFQTPLERPGQGTTDARQQYPAGTNCVGLTVRHESEAIRVDNIVAMARRGVPPALSSWPSRADVEERGYQFHRHACALDHEKSGEITDDGVVLSARGPNKPRGIVARNDRATRQVLGPVGKEGHRKVGQCEARSGEDT